MFSWAFFGHRYKRSLKTKSERQALTRKARIEETIRLVESGRLDIPSDADLATFILSDANRTQQVTFLSRSLKNLAHELGWTTEFARWNDRYRTEAVAAILNKVRPFLMNRNVRAVVSQQGKGLDLRQVMDEGKILIANLSKGQLGEDNANLLGALLVTSIQQAAMSRADVPRLRSLATERDARASVLDDDACSGGDR